MQAYLRLATTILVIAPLGGCCAISQSLTGLFCGPRKDPWVTQAFDTPSAALATFLGAVARDDLKAIYLTLGHALKKHLEIGEVEFQVAWEKIKADTPGIHLADQADITSSREVSTTRHSFTLTMNTVPSVVIEIGVARQNYWSIISKADGSDRVITNGEVVASLGTHLKVRPEGILVTMPGPSIPGLTPSEILSVTAAREWKIDSFRVVE